MKRARTSSAGGSSSSDTSVTTIKLSGGWALPPALVSMWRSGQLTDTVVTVEGRRFDASKNVLASGSEFFRSHFLNEQMARGAVNPTLQEHVSAAAFEPLLAFLYEGECSFDETRLTEVMQAANFLRVKRLEQAAVAAVMERLSPSNALAAWSLADQLSLPNLAEAAKEIALKAFDEVEKIEDATLAQVQALVADDRLSTKSEEVVFSAVARFAEAKHPTEPELLGLLRNVRFALMSKPFLLGTVRPWPMLQSAAGKDMLFESMTCLVSSPTGQPRLGVGGRFLYVLGGQNCASTHRSGYDGGVLSTVEIYDTQTNTWALGTPLPAACKNAAAAVLGGKIFMLGGSTGETSNSVKVFDPQAGAWAEGAPMAKPRAHGRLFVAVASGKLYAIGGDERMSDDIGGERALSVEAFDPQTGAWAEMAPMPSIRCITCAGALNDKIYVIGGNTGGGTSAFEVYDPQTNTWATNTAPRIPHPRWHPQMATLGGKIYVAGGYWGEPYTMVDVFDPQQNSWTAVAPMSTPRYHFSLTTVRDKLYAVGGAVSLDTVAATVETYDAQQDRWEAVASMSEERNWHAAVAV